MAEEEQDFYGMFTMQYTPAKPPSGGDQTARAEIWIAPMPGSREKKNTPNVFLEWPALDNQRVSGEDPGGKFNCILPFYAS